MTSAFRWDYLPGQAISLFDGGHILARYAFAPADAPKPHLHPLTTPRGVPLTAYQPSDHVWHRGLWFSWKYINGVNYWEEETRQRDGGISQLESDGRTLPIGPEVISFEGPAARVVHPLRYVSPVGVEVMAEHRSVTLYPPAPDGLFRIDFAHAFTVGPQAVKLEATPVTPQSPWGGYCGLGIRAARSLQAFEVLTNEGLTGEKANGSRSAWVDLSGTADGGPGLKAGLALIDHPGNPRHPSPTYVYYDSAAFGYINLSPVRDEPLELPPGATLRLAYRAVVHDGPADAAAFDAEAEAFGASSPFTFLDIIK
jgi:hypothetical protein